MTTQSEFECLKNQFSLKDIDFYFLDLIPLIQVIWADSCNQDAELKILYKFMTEYISYLDKLAGAPFVSIEQANDFLDRFAHHKPSDELLKELRLISSLSNENKVQSRHQTVLDYCLDIAAACTNKYPYGMHERIVEEEKQILLKLFKELGIQTDAPVAK